MVQPGAKLTDRQEFRLKISEALFGVFYLALQAVALQDYFKYYDEEIELLQQGILRDTWQITHLAVRTHKDLFSTVDILRNSQSSCRPAIRALLEPQLLSTNELKIDRSINLALRLWLMINVQDLRFESLRYGTDRVEWNDESTLQEFVQGLFPKSYWKITAQSSRLGPYFTAAFMHRVCGLKIEWTTSILDHLRLDRRRKALKVFPYRGHLQALIMSQYNEETPKLPIPLSVLKETKASLDLLFPPWDTETVALLEDEKQTFHKTGPFDATRTLSLRDFEYWRDRLLELHEEVFQSPPVSWAQLWRDRRNPQQFWTFWIAILILLMTTLSTMATIIQAWAAVKALQHLP